MKNKILMQVFFWMAVIAADVLCYINTWNNTATLATIVKYGVLIGSFYLCYAVAYYRLKKADGTIGLKANHKIGLLLLVCTISITAHYYFNLYLLQTNYGLSIWAYCLNRLWIIGPLLYSIVTLLEKQNGQFRLTRLKNEFNATKKDNGQLQAQSQQLQAEIEVLKATHEAALEQYAQLLGQNEALQNEVMINNVEKIMSDEYLVALRQEYARRLKDIEDRLNRQSDDELF